MKKSTLILLFMFCSFSIAAQNIITGTVTDVNETIPGVSILLKDTTNGTVTDFDGGYSINAEKGSVLVFSYIGYISQEIVVKDQSVINVSLEVDVNVLDEVVIVGYGVQKKSDLTGAIATVDVNEIGKVTVATADQALQGHVAGVDVTTNSGSPGGGVTVRIRGIGTLNSSSPLFVVDGMMVDDIDFLNPNDIESIQILKDASSTAIYGSRGSNGVVIISSKKGNKNKEAVVSYNSYYGVQNFWRSTNVMDAKTWATLKNEAMVAAGNPAPIADPSSLQNTDWFDEISNHDAVISSTDISVSGGGEKGSYFISANNFKQDGIVKKTNFDRLTFRANSSYQVKPWLKVGENITLVKNKYKSIAEQDEWTSILITSIAADPASPVRNSDGSFARGIYNDTWNPVAIQEFTNNKDVVYRTIGNIFADIEFMKGLVFKTNYSVEYSFGETDDYDPVYSVSPVQQNSVSKLSKNNSNRLIGQWTNTLDYKKDFGEHSISALIGAEQYSFDYKYNGVSVNNVPSDDIDIRFIDNATENNAATAWGSQEEVRQLSYLSRINYSFKDKYLFTANFRADASSKFSKKNRWGYFPSFSAGWKISDEGFLSNIENISILKIRAGWGQIGNQGSVSPYQDVTTASPGANYLWGGVLSPGSAFPGSGNDEIKWETSTTLNFGLDYGFFNGKLSGSLDYFTKNTTDMLLQVPIPGQTGIQNPPTQNVGAMKNSGFELSALYKNKENDFKYSFGLVFSKIVNEVVDLGAEDAFIDGASFFNSYFVTRTTVGRPIAQFYGFKTDGLFQNQAEIDAQTSQADVAPGDVRYVDADNDGNSDFFFLGSPLPDYTYGFNVNFEYKGLDLTVQLQGVQGNKLFNGTSQYKRSSTATWNLGRDMVNRWTGEGTQNDARYPRMNANDVNNSRMSDRFIEDGSYLRIKTLQLGYNVSITDKMPMDKLRLYLNAQNLFTFTNYSGLDPEIGIRNYNPLDVGVDRGFYPQARVFSFGVNLAF
ncbi:Outer membrane TonB-dependent transporter, utilization system for glycans and polysaccharides (PUL), SusC family [hydrothermal vent metagenome]|uniref:Outer membrane TonB-dependent transporter, utilization system for glycans and polysaccharides (PUL), SusC family n=1 Tax=hydrothermal vent metagenome TaxID=652676 RepID=A0A3B0TEG5_9ZZZZ